MHIFLGAVRVLVHSSDFSASSYTVQICLYCQIRDLDANISCVYTLVKNCHACEEWPFVIAVSMLLSESENVLYWTQYRDWSVCDIPHYVDWCGFLWIVAVFSSYPPNSLTLCVCVCVCAHVYFLCACASACLCGCVLCVCVCVKSQYTK